MFCRTPARALLGGFVFLALGQPFASPQEQASAAQVRRIRVQPDQAPDCSSLKAIVDSVTRGCKTNDERAIALYNFMLLTHYHQGYPGEKGGLGALKEINVYGWSLCGGLHTVEAALWKAAGWPWRYVGWSAPGHTTVEVQYDGRWHYLDVFLRFYAWVPDPNAPGGRTIASQEDLQRHPELITAGLELDRARGVYFHTGNRFEVVDGRANWLAPSFLSCGDRPQDILTGIRSRRGAGSPTGWAGLEFDSPGYSTDVNLAPGAGLNLTWDPIPGAHWWNGRQYVPGHGCGDRDYRNCPVIGPIMEPYNRTGGLRRSFANGRLTYAPHFTRPAALDGLLARDNVQLRDGTLVPADPARPASITVGLQSPYVMTRATGAAEGADRTEVSTDGGKTFQAVQLADFSDAVGGAYACQVRLTFAKALSALRLEAIVQCNRGSLPYLSPGRNRITVDTADPKELGDNRLVITYAYRPGFRTKSYEQLADAGAELGRAHYAQWSETPTVVQKVFTAQDLPATFDIDVPTPAGKYPVYPRMLFVRREVVPPGGQAQPPPAGAATARPAPAEQLQTLPNPFTVGAAAPPKRVERPTATRTYPLAASHTVSIDGKVEPNHHLAWKKGNTWVMLIGGDLGGLPPARDIVAARLVVPVVRGHDKAAVKVGASLLGAPFAPGQPFDYRDLGEVTGTGILPKQPAGGDYNPPRPFAIDVTRAVKQLAAGERPFRGFALRVIQDRSVDDGWLVRVDLPPAARPVLEIEAYDRK